ncbi:MAG TPA: hypothetical protein VN668_09740 [Stellaceae bacterium]|nr:hypothetical protein [Stellaceae bacterium]
MKRILSVRHESCASRAFRAIGGTAPALLIATLALCVAAAAQAQTRTFNAEAPGRLLRQWSRVGVWQTFLTRSLDHDLVCATVSGRTEAGHFQYAAGLSQRPDGISLFVADVNKMAVSGNRISLVIDGIRVGYYWITARTDGSPLHSVRALVPAQDTGRVINLFGTGGTVQFVTDRFTYTFPLTGAARSLANMRDCSIEMANLSHAASH